MFNREGALEGNLFGVVRAAGTCPCRRCAYVTENEITIYLLNNLAAFLLTTYQNYDKIACQYHTSRPAR